MFNEMKQRIHYLEYIYCHLLICFMIGRVAFILNNRVVEQLSFADAVSACWRGFLNHDLMVAAFLLAVPWLMGVASVYLPARSGERSGGLKLRAWLAPYFVLMGFFVALIIK